MKRLIICADDYGLTPGVSKGIRELLEKEKISATSCMTLTACWKDEGLKLKQAASNSSIGLHITLTDLKPLTSMPNFVINGKMPSINQLIINSYAKKLPLKTIALEIEAQFKSFTEVYGKLPMHIDGHQHVHLLPGIRDIILELYNSYYPKKNVPIRSCQDTIANIFNRKESTIKSLIINFLSKNLYYTLKKSNIPTNDNFAGIYDFNLSNRSYADIFKKFTKFAPDNTLIMCHPGYIDKELIEMGEVAESREKELEFFNNRN